jgi:hypothetical protein
MAFGSIRSFLTGLFARAGKASARSSREHEVPGGLVTLDQPDQHRLEATWRKARAAGVAHGLVARVSPIDGRLVIWNEHCPEGIGELPGPLSARLFDQILHFHNAKQIAFASVLLVRRADGGLSAQIQLGDLEKRLAEFSTNQPMQALRADLPARNRPAANHGTGGAAALVVDPADDDDFETDVVGESFRQEALRRLVERVRLDQRGRRLFMANLRPEPDNPYDVNAVAVHAADDGSHLGYLSRELAPTYQRHLVERGGATVPALLTGGGVGKPHHGVCIDLTALDRHLGIEHDRTVRPAARIKPPLEPRVEAGIRGTEIAPAPDPSFIVDTAPELAVVLDGTSPFEKGDLYAVATGDGQFHLVPYDAWVDPEAPVRLAQKRPEEWSVDDFARRARITAKTRARVERHFLYNDLVSCLYKRRHESAHARSLCECLSRQHVAEWPQLAPDVATALGTDDPPVVPSFERLATILKERGAYADAVQVCEEAIRRGLSDGTTSGFLGRIRRIESARKRARPKR